MESRTLSFGYKSIGNFARLISTIIFEKNHNGREVAIWHERFDEEDGDDLFEQFLADLYPEGKTIEPEDVEIIVNHAVRFLMKDEKTRQIRNRYAKFDNPYWVYFKPDDIVYPCGYAKHAEKVREICKDYFKDFDDIDPDFLKKFILENFEICSDNSTIEKIAKDSRYMCITILLDRDMEEELNRKIKAGEL